jgi:hypothetical protein
MSFADLQDLFNVVDDFSEPFTRVRSVAGTYVDGRAVRDPAPAALVTRGSVTPAKHDDLQRLPEGRRADRVLRVLTSTELRLAPQADRVLYRGEEFEVGFVSPWHVGNFYDALIIRVQEP